MNFSLTSACIKLGAVLAAVSVVSGCTTVKKEYPYQVNQYVVYDERMLDFVDTDNQVEVLAGDFKWAEGPVWSAQLDCLLFTDIPNNVINKYCEDSGVTGYLKDVDYANGLVITQQGELVMMQGGSRQAGKMLGSIDNPEAKFATLAGSFEGGKLNSPNDVVLHSNGDLYFTDPPYGLPKRYEDPNKELDFQGVFRYSQKGGLTLQDKSIYAPNGIALSKNEDKLLVAVSDDNDPLWYIFDINKSGDISNRQLLLDPKQYESDKSKPGKPDGLKVHSSGVIFATGPNGIWVFEESGKLLGRVLVDSFVANVAFDNKEEHIYLTAHTELLRVKLKSN